MKAFFLLSKRPDITIEEFNRHWREVHRPLLMAMPGLERLVLNYMQPDPNGAAVCDGIVEAWFASPEAMQASFASPAGQAASADAPQFVDQTKMQVLIVDEDTALPAG